MMLRTRKRDRISKSSSVHASQLKVTLLQQKQTKLHLQAPHPEKKSSLETLQGNITLC